MKNPLSILSTAFMVIMMMSLSSCDLEWGPGTFPENIDYEVKVIDQATQLPVNSAQVTTTWVKDGSSNDLYRAGSTKNGIFTCSVPPEYSLRYLAVEKNHYASICLDYPNPIWIYSNQTQIVSLQKNGIVELHVQNIAPYSEKDFISIEFPNGGCNETWLFNFKGASIDTILRLETRPGDSYISWEFSNNDIGTAETIHLSFPSDEVIKKEILY